jgi:hypothetical protein
VLGLTWDICDSASLWSRCNFFFASERVHEWKNRPPSGQKVTHKAPSPSGIREVEKSCTYFLKFKREI